MSATVGPEAPVPAPDQQATIRPFDQRSATVLMWCAAASLGLLFLKVNGTAYSVSMVRNGIAAFRNTDVVTYLPLLAPVIGLLAWHRYPRRAAPWLLLAGAVCAAPMVIVSMRSGSYNTDLLAAIFVLGAGAPALTLIGVLAAATVIWRQGRRALGACLIGTAVVIQLVGPIVLASAMGEAALWGISGSGTLNTLAVVFLVLAAAGAVVALAFSFRAPPTFPGSPPWPTTIAGCLVALAQAMPILWQPAVGSIRDRTIDQHYLYLGLAFLAIGVLVAAIAGLRVLVAAAGVGLLVGVFSVLLAPAVEVLAEMPVLAVAAGIVSVLVSGAVALSPHRARIGVSGIAAVAVGLLALLVVTNSDAGYSSYRGILLAVTPVLLVVGIVAALSSVAAVGDVLSERLEAPAVLAGVASAFASGAAAISAYFTINPPSGRAAIVGLLPVTAVGLVLAAGLIAALTITMNRSRPADPPAGPGADAATPRAKTTADDEVETDIGWWPAHRE